MVFLGPLWLWRSGCLLLGILAFSLTLICTSIGLAQTTPTITLSVPAGSKFAEGEGTTTVVITATLANAETTDTVVDLTLGGTSKSTDYTVTSLPDITIPAGDTVGTADLILLPTDDAYFEGKETITVGGTVNSGTVTVAEVPLIDNDRKPNFALKTLNSDGLQISGQGVFEGETRQITLVAVLTGQTFFEEDTTVTITFESAQEGDVAIASKNDVNFGQDNQPWEITIDAGKTSGERNLTLTIVDDSEAEAASERINFKAEFMIGVESFTAIASDLVISASDLPIHISFQCSNSNKHYPGSTYKQDCRLVSVRGDVATKDYTAIYSHNNPNLTPTQIELTLKKGESISTPKTITFEATENVGTTVIYFGSLTPRSNEEFNDSIRHIFYPPANSSYVIDNLEVSFTKGASSIGDWPITISFLGPGRPFDILGPAQIDVNLDNKVITIPCETSNLHIRCNYRVKEGDYDFDKQMEIPAGAVKFTGWQDKKDPTITGMVASPLPSVTQTYPFPGQIYGGSHPIDLIVSPESLQEGTGEQMLTITASNLNVKPGTKDLVIPLQFSNSSTNNSDYSVRGPLSITIPAGETDGKTSAIFFTPTDDFLKENRKEVVLIEGSKGAGMSPFVKGIDLTILDAAGLVLSVSPDAITEDRGSQKVTITARLGDDGDSTIPKNINIPLIWSGSATSADYSRTGGDMVTIPANERSGTTEVTIKPVDDKLLETDETIFINGAVPGRTVQNTKLTLKDDEMTPQVQLLVNPKSISEGATTTSFTVSAKLDPEVTDPNIDTRITLDLGGTATEGTDYSKSWTPVSPIITIPRGQTEGSDTVQLTLTPTNDTIAEGNEEIVIEGSTARNLEVQVAPITLIDDDVKGVILSTTELTVNEGDAKAYTIKLGTQPTGDVSVSLSSNNATTATTDSRELTFTTTNWNIEQTVTVNGINDDFNNVDDKRTTVIQHIAGGGGYDDITIDLPIEVTDDDEATKFSINNASATEGDTINFTVTRTGATGRAVSVKWATAEDTTDGSVPASTADYTIQTTPQILDFAVGDTFKTFTVNTTEDNLHEGNETFLIILSEASTGSSINDGSGIGTITDDDAAPSGITLSVDTNGSTDGTPDTVAEDAGATVVTVTATVNGATRYVAARTIAVSVGDGTATSPADYAAITNFNITIPAGAASQTGSFTLTPVDDALDEADETIEVAGTLNAITITGTTVTLSDTDEPVSFAIADAEATEGGKVTFTVTRNGAADNVVSVKVKTAEDTSDGAKPAATTDYTAITTAQTLSFAKGVTSQTVEVQTTQDDLFEPDETFLASLSEPALADGDPGTGISIEDGKETATGTIRNDDTEPSFAVANASAAEGEAMTFTVTRTGAMDNVVSVKWNTKAATGNGAAASTDYTEQTTATKLDFAKGEATQTFTVNTTEDNLHEGNETFLVELTAAEGGTITTAEATGTITDDDAAPSGITLSVDTNGSTDGTPDTVAEDAGATVVTVTATVNGATRYVAARTIAVSVGDGTATSPADYAAITNFNITIPAGAASQTGSFTLTPVDDALDEADETIEVAGTLNAITITGTTVTLSDTDEPVSFAIADAEATEGGKVTFTVTRNGAADNVVSVKVKTAEDTSDGAKPAATTDYTAITTAQTLSFAKGVTSQTVEVQTTQDDLFEPDETFLASLSEPALADGDPGTGISIEDGKETATGTIRNDDTEPSFAVANASAAEGEAMTFTVTRTGAMDNVVSVKWNTKAATGNGAAASTDYTEQTTATKLDFAKGEATQTFTVNTTEDNLHEGNETFLVELTAAEGGTITTAEATGTITDDDAAPSGITLSVDTNGSTDGTPDTVAEDAGATVVTVTATVNGATRYVAARTIAVSVGDGTATSPADYAAITNFNITIPAGAASQTGSFTLTPVDDALDEADETIEVAGTLNAITITGTTVTLSDTDEPVSFAIADAEATEGGKVTFTVTRNGAADNVVSVKVKTAEDTSDGAKPAATTDYTAITTAQTLSFAKGVTSQTVEVQTTQDDLFEPDETFLASLSEPALADGDPGTGISIEDGKETATGTIRNDDTEPSFAVANASAAEGEAMTFTVTRTGAMDNVVSVKWNTKAATGNGAAASTDYTEQTTATKLDFAKGEATQTFTVNTTEDNLHEGNETFLVELTAAEGGTITTAEATGTITDDDAAPSGITLSVDTNGSTDGTPDTVAEDAGATVVTVTATVNGATRYVAARTIAVSVGDGTATSPADYAAITNFNITIPAGAASQTGSFTLTPVDDALDEADETIEVAGTLNAITITGTTVTLSDTDEPVSFAIADAEATEGGKVTFTVTRNGAADNVVSVKVKTAEDTSDGAKPAATTDYTAITTAQTLSFAKGVTSQTVEVQTTQDDLFEPDETFLASLSEPALADGDPGTGISIEDGKETATGTIRNDDTEPSFAVANASAAEGEAMTFTVTRTGAMDNVVSVKWNTKAATGNGAAASTDYTEQTTATKLDFAKGEATQTFTVNTTEDNLHEGNETFLVELTAAEGGTITTAEATGTITDDDAAPSGITLSVDTNGSTDGTPDTVAEDAGATVVTVTATVNGATRYVAARTIAVSVGDGTATSPADYAAITNFNITIPAGAASQTGSFTLTPVDDALDEADETIEVAGTLNAITITGTTVTLSDTDEPVSFAIADAEATEGGKVTFTVTRNGAADNVVSVKVKTAEDTSDGAKPAATTDYTAITTAQTLSFAKGVTSQTVEVQTTQDDLFEPDETFLASLSEPALADGDPGTGISIEDGKETATGTIRNDDTEPSFAVANASAAEGEAMTFTVTRTGAMDNVVSVKWNTKAATGNGAAASTDYTEQTTATKLDFAKGEATQTFTVNTTEDNLHEGNETFLVELTAAEGGTITTAEATGTITDDDAAPSGITLSVDTNGSTDGTPDTVAEDAGATVVTVTATVNGATRYVAARTIAVSVGDGTATSPADYAAITNFNITIPAGAASQTGSFTLTPVDDALDEADETIEVAGTLNAITITGTTVTLSDTDEPVSFAIADAEATEGGKVTFTVTRNGAADNVVSVKVKTAEDTSDGAKPAATTDYTAITTAQTLSFAKGVTSQTVEVQTTQDDLFEPDETFLASLSEPALADGDPGTGISIEDGKETATGTIRNDDTEPSFAVANASAAEGEAMTFTVTRTGAMDNVVSVKWNTKAATGNGAAASTDYTEQTTATKLDFAKGEATQTFTVNTTEDNLHEGNETFLVELTAAEGGTITTAEATGTITDDDAAPTTLTLTMDADTSTIGTQTSITEDGGAKTVRVTATLGGSSTFNEDKSVTIDVGKAADTANEGTDYTNVAQQSITITAGETSGYVDFTLTPTNDKLLEDEEEFISIKGTIPGLRVQPTELRLALTDDEVTPAVTLSVNKASLSESGNAVSVSVSAILDPTVAMANDVTTITLALGGTATAGTDYSATWSPANKQIAIPLGDTKGSNSVTLTLTPRDDQIVEGDETIVVQGSAFTDMANRELVVKVARIDLEDDDSQGINLSPRTLKVVEADDSGTSGTIENEATYEVWLGTVPTGNVTVSLASTNDTVATVAPKTLTFTATTWNMRQTVTLSGQNDDYNNANDKRTADISHTASGGGYNSVATAILGVTVTDDDEAPAFEVADAEATEGNAITFTVSRTGAPGHAVSVKWNTKAATGDDVASSSDYTASTTASKLDFAVGDTSKTFTVQTTEDNLHEENETFLVELTEAMGGTITTAEATGTINDDDPAPTTLIITVDANLDKSGTQPEVPEGGGPKEVQIVATLGGSSTFTEDKNVEVSVVDNTATSPADYTAITNFNITIPAGAASQTGSFTLTPVDDALDEADETINVTGTLSDITTPLATVIIVDDDDPVSFAIADAEATEGGKVTFTVTRNGAADNVVSVKVKTAEDTSDGAKPAATTDYTAITTAQTLSFAKGVTSQTVEVQTTQDDLFEPDETFLASLSEPALADGDPGTGISIEDGKETATGTIRNDDTEPSFAVANASAAEGEAMTFTVTRTGAMDNVVSVKWNTKAATGNGAAASTDYTEQTTATKLDFAKGEATQTFTVNTTEDNLHEGNETFLVELTAAEGGTITTAEATGTITDDDAAPSGITLSVDTNGSTDGTPDTVAEDAGATVVTVTATVNGATRYVAARTIAVSVGDGTATSPADYAAITNFNITIPAGAASQTGSFTLTPVDDALDEADETIEVAGTLNAITITGTTVTLSDTDEPVSFAIADAEATEGGKVTFTVTRNGAADNVVSVKVKTAEDTSDGAKPAATTDYTAITTAQTLSFAKGVTSQTVEVQTTQDDLFEPDETFLASLSEPALADGDPGTGISIEDGKETATGTIRNDEGTPTVSLVLTPTTINESGATNKSTVTATLSGASSTAVTLTIGAAAGADTGAGDFTLSNNTTLTIAAGTTTSTGEVTITAVDNAVDAPNKSVTVSAAASGGSVANPGSQTLTITDDEGTPTVSLVLKPTTINESGATNKSTVTATLSGASSTAVTLTIGAAAGADTGAGDFTLSNNTTLTIAAGTTTSTGEVTITAVDNAVDAPNKSVTISATASGGSVANPGSQTLTITDDEGTPTVSLVLKPTTINESGATNKSTITATLSGASSTAVTLTVAATAGADTATGDFTLSNNTTLTIAAGTTTSTGEVTITAVDNAVDAPNKSVTISATASGGSVANPGSQTLTITDDEGTPTVSLVLKPTTINESGATNKSTVTATLSGASSTAVTLTIGAAAGADTGAGDFTLSNNTTLTIAAGTTTSTGEVTITAVDNAVDAPNKSVTVSAAASGGSVANPGSQTLTITDDEGTPTVSLVLKPTTINESGATNKSTVTATLSGASSTAVTLTIGAAAGADTGAGDFTLSNNTTLTIAAGTTTSTGEVTITAVDNAVDAPNKSVTISATASGGSVANPGSQTLTITDDEGTPTVSLVLKPTTINESGATNKSTVTATLSGASSTAVTLTIGAAAGADTGAGDFTLSNNTTLTIAAGTTTSTGEVTITAVDNAVDAPNKSVTVSAAASGGSVANPGSQTLTITDDEGTPTVSLVLKPTTINESGATNKSTVTATLSGASSTAVTLTVAATAGADTATGDFTLSNNTTLTIAAGTTTSTGEVTITAVDNAVDAPNKSVTVSAAASGGSVANPGSQTLTITDDEGTPTVSLVLKPTTINESGATNKSTVTATLSGASSTAVTLTIGAAAGADTGAGDFTLSNNTTLTIAAGTTTSTGEVTITAVDNAVDAPNKSVTVSAAASGGSVANPGSQTLTITDDEGTPTVSLVLKPTTINESGATNKSTITATLSGASSTAVTLTVAATAGADTATGDFTLSNNTTLTIAAGTTTSTGEVTITAVDNAVDAPNKSVTVSAAASGGSVANPGNQTLTITDDEEPTLSIDAPSITEGNNGTVNLTFTVTLAPASSQLVSVTFADTGTGMATSATDYTAITAGTLNFAAGETEKTISVRVNGDTMDEPNETVILRLSSPTNAALKGGGQTLDGTGTITDDDGTLTLALSSASITENGGSSTITATLSKTLSEAVTLTIAAAPVSPAVAGDFTLSTNKTLSIAAGSTTSTGTVTITAVNNEVDAPNKIITVSATASGGNDVAHPANKSLTITDDDAQPTLHIDAPSVTEGNSGPTTLTFRVTLSAASGKPVSVTYADAGTGTATSSTDYTTIPTGTLNFAAGETEKTVSVTVNGDTLDEPDETVVLRLASPTNAVLAGNGQTLDGTGTITDDDGTITLLLSSASITENGGSTTIAATLSKELSEAVTLTIAAAPVSPAVAGDFTLSTNKILSIAAGSTTSTGTVTITAVDNNVVAANKTINVSATVSGGNSIANPIYRTLTITNDDEKPTTMTLKIDADTNTNGVQTSIAENGGAKMVKVTATLGDSQFPTSQDVTIRIGKNTDTATKGADYTEVATQTITFPANTASASVTFTITPIDDAFHEEDETISIEGELDDVIITGTALTLTSEDTASAFAIADASAIEGQAIQFTVTRTGETGDVVSVKWNTTDDLTDGSNPAGLTDYTQQTTAQTLNFAAGDKTKTISVATTHDLHDEEDETFLVQLSDASTGTSITDDTAIGTITDDDEAPTITLSVDTDDNTNGIQTSIAEHGGDRMVKITANLGDSQFPTSQDVTIKIGNNTDTATKGTDYIDVADQTITIPANTAGASVTFTITPIDDAFHEEEESISIEGELDGTIITGTAITLTSDDAQPIMSINSPTVMEGSSEMSPLNFIVTLDKPSDKRVTVEYADAGTGTATSGVDYKVIEPGSFIFAAGETNKSLTVMIRNDLINEDNETVILRLSSLVGAVFPGGSSTLDGIGTIKNDDSLPEGWLARFGRTVTEQVLESIASRVSEQHYPGIQGTLAGYNLDFGSTSPDRSHSLRTNRSVGQEDENIANLFFEDTNNGIEQFNAVSPYNGQGFNNGFTQSQSMTAQEALLGSSFAVTKEREGGRYSFWGRVSQGRFDSVTPSEDVNVNLEGKVTTGMLGADQSRGKWLVGIAVAKSSGKGSYEQEAASSVTGRIEASLTSLIPYASLRYSESLSFWATLGFGSGKMSLTSSPTATHTADIDWKMAALGMRGDLITPSSDNGNFMLAVTSDAMLTKISSEETEGLSATDSKVTRFRVGLEGSWYKELEDGSSLTPKLEVGIRYDGGDAETGMGVEVGGGIIWDSPLKGISIGISGRTLVMHDDRDFKDRGASLWFTFDPYPETLRGPSVTLRQDFEGNAEGGVDNLFNPAPLENRTNSAETSRTSIEMAYGFPAFGDNYTGSPHVGADLADNSRNYRLGWRLTPEASNTPDFELGIVANRKEYRREAPDHGAGFEIATRW